MPILRKKTRLLLLDDDPSMQRLIGKLLRDAGHRVDAVAEASQAIERLGRFDYDALLLDIMTPTEGGMTVIEHLRQTRPELLERIVLVTGSPPSVLKRVKNDVFGILRKPFDGPELIAIVNRVVAK